jgi:hypothetical protein
MGGSVGKTLDPTSNNFLGAGPTIGRALGGGLTMGMSELGRPNPYGIPGLDNPLGNGSIGNMFGGQNNPYVSGPFSLDPNQLSADQSALTGLGKTQQGDINALAQQQYDQTLKNVPSEVAGSIQQENPQIMEDLNKGGLLNSTAYPQEIARQQEYLTQNLVEPATQALFAGQQSGLQTAQGLQTGAVQRGLSLEDQINNANISKSIGQAFAPAPPTGKQNFGTTAQGIGALAPWAKLGKAGGTAAAGAIA